MSSSVFPELAGSTIDVERRPVYETTVQTEASGRELRIARRSAARYRYRIRFDFLRQDVSPDEAQALLGFFAAHRGSWESFLYLDPYAEALTAAEFGLGDGTTTTFYLRDEMGDRIASPVGSAGAGWFVYKAGVVQSDPADFTYTAEGGVIVFASAPAVGASLTWSGQYYRRCRFASDELGVQRVVARIWRGEVELVSVL